jgi:UDP:flavonoid glycosyltransferase YjiC (YdhE family)
MSRFLFATMPATGHVAPKLPIAHELATRGHDVHWYTGAVYRSQVQAVGAVHHPIRSVIMSDVTEHYERARQQVGLPRLGRSFIDTFASPYLYLQPTVTSFEYPRRDLPEQLHFIGPLLPRTDVSEPLPEWWPELEDDRRVVLVTQGTVATDPRHLLIPTIEALDGEPALVVVTTGGPVGELLDALPGSVPANVRIEQFVPYAQLMPHVDVLVTNGGYGTVQQALAHGVPIVVAGATEDKPENAARIAWSQTGVRIRSQRPAPRRIREAVRAVSEVPRYRERTTAIAAEMAGCDAPRAAADLLEQLARSGEPVTDRARGRELTEAGR